MVEALAHQARPWSNAQVPGYTKTIICLANSRKLSGRCIAGKEYENGRIGKWIRPVSPRPAQEISEHDRRYEDGSLAQLLDIVSIPMTEPRPSMHQQENHAIDDGYYWECVDRANWQLVQRSVDSSVVQLWHDGDSSYHGTNDRMLEEVAQGFGHSLVLVDPGTVRFRVLAEGADFGSHKKIVRASFSLAGAAYALRVTDPSVERQLCARGEGNYDIEQAILCVSLAEDAYQGHCYKLVASAITPARCSGASAWL